MARYYNDYERGDIVRVTEKKSGDGTQDGWEGVIDGVCKYVVTTFWVEFDLEKIANDYDDCYFAESELTREEWVEEMKRTGYDHGEFTAAELELVAKAEDEEEEVK